MKEQIKKMKLELKELARQIKEDKSNRKDPTKNNGCGYIPGLYERRIAFRHKHVAYCLVRGRKLEQIDSGFGLNMDQVNWIIQSMQLDSKEKLYVVVNESLSPSQQAVQSAHAVAEFLRQHPNTQWSNGHLILLKDKTWRDGDMYCTIKWDKLVQYAEFKEPDIGNKITAYACFGQRCPNQFKHMVLL